MLTKALKTVGIIMEGTQESSVRERYAAAARRPERDLCCPVDHDPSLMKAIPDEVIEKDYGCGDPSRYLAPGETVLDLGCGAGKICFMAAQVVGPKGRVIGVDMTDEMLEVARRHQPLVAERLGYSNVEFRKGKIQDLALDLDRMSEALRDQPIHDATSFLEAEELADRLRRTQPLVPSDSVDAVVSNCVLNLVAHRSKQQLFEELYRVLRKGGRAIISDIVSDEPVPEDLQKDPELWSGCLSGALTEEGFLNAFETAGFHGMQWLQFQTEPWRTVRGIEFRSVTVEAFKGKKGPCFERNQAVVYKGPFKAVFDDDGHRFERGRRHAVCEKTYELLKKAPYRESFQFIDPLVPVHPEAAEPFDCKGTPRRDPRETKGQGYQVTTEISNSCTSDSCCS